MQEVCGADLQSGRRRYHRFSGAVAVRARARAPAFPPRRRGSRCSRQDRGRAPRAPSCAASAAAAAQPRSSSRFAKLLGPRRDPDRAGQQSPVAAARRSSAGPPRSPRWRRRTAASGRRASGRARRRRPAPAFLPAGTRASSPLFAPHPPALRPAGSRSGGRASIAHGRRAPSCRETAGRRSRLRRFVPERRMKTSPAGS